MRHLNYIFRKMSFFRISERHSKILMFIMATLLAGVFGPTIVMAENQVKKPDTWENTSLTLYKTMALVRDKKSVSLKNGQTSTLIIPVSGKIIPESAVVSCNKADILEKSFIFKPLSPQSLLQGYIGKEVFLIKTDKDTGKEESISATLLSADKGIVLKIGNRIETTIPGRIAFPGLPEGMGDKPVLKVKLQGKTDGDVPVGLAYLTRGISWNADYVAVLDPSAKNLSFQGWITIRNNSGISFQNASVQLVAGDVNEERKPGVLTRNFGMEKAAAPASPLGHDVSQEALFEYHLYSLERAINLDKNILKQVALFTAEGVPFTREFLVIGNRYPFSRSTGARKDKLEVSAIISFANNQASHLGIAIPKGEVRLYKNDSSGRLQFIGKDDMVHTPKGEEVKLNLGKAFDITCTRVQKDFKKLAGGDKYSSVYESSYEVTIKNSKKEPVVVKYLEPISGTWQITFENVKHEKPDANSAMWTVEIPAEGEMKINFTVRVRY